MLEDHKRSFNQNRQSCNTGKQFQLTPFFTRSPLLGFPTVILDVFPIGFSAGSGGGLCGASFKAVKNKKNFPN